MPDRDRAGLAAEVFAILTEDDHGVHGDIVAAFSAALEEEGLGELERLIRCELDRRQTSGENTREWELARGLKDIADARGDVDGYIAAQRVAGHEDGALADIVRRLLDAGRLDEALTRIETTAVPDHRRYGIVPLYIEVLERLGRMEDVQRVRWREFERTLGRGMLDDYLSGLPEEKRATAIAKAVDVAVRHPAVHSALPLLIDLDRAAAARLVLDRFAALSGGLYTTLRPAAQALEAEYPLPASLLYRCMADAVLAKAQSAYYDYAVGDLAAAECLAPLISDWQGHPTHDDYRRQIAEKHRQKSSLWKLMTAARLVWRK